MKKQNIWIFIIILDLLIFCQSSFALTLNDGDSLWVSTTSVAPSDFDGMTLFWGLTGREENTVLEYNIYRPDGYSGAIENSPFSVDLSPFEDNTVIFEFKSIGGSIDFGKTAVWDKEIPEGKYEWTDDEFYFAFYELGESGDRFQRWQKRSVVEYMPGEILSSEPAAYGDLLFSYSLEIGNYALKQLRFIRSDFIAKSVEPVIPEPGTLLLLGSGLVGIIALWSRKRK